MKRKLLAVGVSTLALAFGATSALATPTGAPASQSNATTQILPVAAAAPITLPVNLSVPVAIGGSNGDTTQANHTAVDGSATNNSTEQAAAQHGSGGSSSAAQSNATAQKVPVAVSAPVTAPVNLSVPVAVAGSNGATNQSNHTAVDGSAANNDTSQAIVQGSDHKKGPGSDAAQSNHTLQILPVALAAPVTLPVNVSVPVAFLGSNGDTTQANHTAVDGSATNNATRQLILQGSAGDKPGDDPATAPPAVLKDEDDGTTQANHTAVDGSATNNATRQLILQAAGGSASQSNHTLQIVPVALAKPVTLPVNLSIPVAIGLLRLPPLPRLPLVGAAGEVVGGALADPVGTLGAAAGDPLGTAIGTLGALGLPALPALPLAGLPLPALPLAGLPLPALPLI